MGRRSLPRVDKNIELGEYLFSLSDFTDPWTPFDLFDRPAELEIEVGSGKGLFLASTASRLPDADFVGIEIVHKYARFSAARLARCGLTNAKIIHGDALALFTQHLPTDRIAAVHVYFPDPWWKLRHRKRRIMNDAFLRAVQRVLQPHGELHFWTDVEEYFQRALEQIRVSTQLDGPRHVEEAPAAHDLDYQTHFERRMRLHERPVYRSCFRKLGFS